jgi:hypothetical protein
VLTALVLTWLFSGACGDRPEETVLEAPEIEFSRLAVIGPGVDQGDGAFGSIADLEIGEDGSVFVLDGMNRTVSAFDQASVSARA